MTNSNDARIEILVPTAINICLMVNENVMDNLRRVKEAGLTLPSLYRRAFLVVNETDEVAIVRQEVT